MSRERCETHIDIHFPLNPTKPDTPKVKVLTKVNSPDDFLTAYQEFLDENKPTDSGSAHMSVRCILTGGHTDMPHTFNVGVKFLGKPGAV